MLGTRGIIQYFTRRVCIGITPRLHFTVHFRQLPSITTLQIMIALDNWILRLSPFDISWKKQGWCSKLENFDLIKIQSIYRKLSLNFTFARPRFRNPGFYRNQGSKTLILILIWISKSDLSSYLELLDRNPYPFYIYLPQFFCFSASFSSGEVPKWSMHCIWRI